MLFLKRLRQVLDYDPVSGIFTWKHRPDAKQWWNTKYAGRTAGSVEGDGYFMTAIDGRSYRLHRLAWFYVYGEWPKGDLDHKDMDRSHNWINNLRPATASQNAANAGLYESNSSGVKGVSFAKRERKWKAYIRKDGSYVHLGYFLRLEDAAAARRIAAITMQGTFAHEPQVPRE